MILRRLLRSTAPNSQPRTGSSRPSATYTLKIEIGSPMARAAPPPPPRPKPPRPPKPPPPDAAERRLVTRNPNFNPSESAASRNSFFKSSGLRPLLDST
ncbi:MAG: hypothetical protein FJ403_06675 [Verrucomicrobia bacterium]|nr:hypothetical protein [Verrucomicrobiota bacterium]